MTLPNALKDKLIFWAYLSLSPSAPVLLNLSLPAKSTKFNLLATYRFSYWFVKDTYADSKYNINNKCDLEESLFMAVYPTDLFLLPMFIYSINSECVFAVFIDKSFIKTPFYGLYFI